MTWTAERRAVVVSMWLQGSTVREIAARLGGTSPGSVGRVACEEGLPPRPRGKRSKPRPPLETVSAADYWPLPHNITDEQIEMANWTDERVEALKKLWQEGLTASQIAKQLGACSRNAVIGKAHRLGLSNRPKVSAPRALRPAREPQAAMPRRPLAPPRSVIRPEATPTVSALKEAPGLATVLTLGVHMCKWPIGDPGHEGFTFCGHRSRSGPYCVEHARVAFASPARPARTGPRRRRTRLALKYLDH